MKLEKFTKRRKKANVDDIVDSFVKKFPKYEPFRGEIYERACQIMGQVNTKIS